MVAYLPTLHEAGPWQLLGSVKLGYYFHRQYQQATYLTAGLQYAHTTPSGLFWGPEVTVGRQQSWAVAAYNPTSAGTWERQPSSAGQWISTIGMRLGKTGLQDGPWGWFLAPQYHLRQATKPNRDHYLTFEIGALYQL